MFVDTHMHEMTCSKDSFLKLEEMVEIAKEKGLGAICITDHDDMGLKEYAAAYSKKTGISDFCRNRVLFPSGGYHSIWNRRISKGKNTGPGFYRSGESPGGILFCGTSIPQ